MKPSNSTSTEGLSAISLEGDISSGYITYLLSKITDSEVENSSINIDQVDLEEQVLGKLLRSIAEGKNDKRTVDGIYLIEAGGHFVMLNLQNQDGIINYKVFDSLSHTPNGPRRVELLTDILRNRFGADNITPSEGQYVRVQQGIDISAQDSDNCGLLCFFAQLIDEKKLTLEDLSPHDTRYHDLNKTLNRLRGKNIRTIDLDNLSQELLGLFIPSLSTQDLTIAESTENNVLREVIFDIFKKYENSTKLRESKPRPFAEARISDLERLEQISHYISSITRKEEITEEILNKIGEETAKIVVNNSSKNNFIRNRYGLIGSKSDFTTKDGIEFMGLQTLRYIQESDLDPAKMDDLFQGLQITRQKIDFVIQEERGGSRYKSSVAQLRRDAANVDDLAKFSRFTREFYSQFLIDGIVRELDLLRTIDPSQSLLKTSDKYFASRALAKIGERAKELLDHNNDDELGQKVPLFKFLREIRNKVSHTDPFILIDREVSGELLKALLDVVSSSLVDGVDEERQKKIDEIYEGLQRKKSGKSSTVERDIKTDSEQEDPFFLKTKLLIEKAKRYFELEQDVADLPSLNSRKDSIDQSWQDAVVPLDLERDQVYGVEVRQLELNLEELLENYPELIGIDEKLTGLAKKQTDGEKEIKALEKKLKQQQENLDLIGKTNLTNGESSRLLGIYKTKDVTEIKPKIEKALEQIQKDIDEKAAKLLEVKKETGIKEASEYKELKRFQEAIKDEKKKSQDAMADLNARRSKIDEEMGRKIRDINIQIHETEQKEADLLDTRGQILNLMQELGASATNIAMVFDENLFEEIEEALVQDQFSRKDSKKDVDQQVTKEKVSKKLGKINEQLEYMHSIYSDGSLGAEERSYILQHAFSIIGQNSRDIEDLEKDIVSQDSFKSLTKSSLTFSDSWRSNIKTRNKQISHDIDSFDEDLFFRVVRNDTLSISEDIRAIRELVTFDYEQSKAQFSENIFDYTFGAVMNNIALSHLRLGNYHDAESCFNETLRYFDQSRIIEKFKDNDPIILENGPSGIARVAGSNPNLIVFVNHDKDFYARKSLVLGNFAELFLRTERWNEALSMLEESEKLHVVAHGNASKINLSNQAFLLGKLGRTSEAKAKIKLASEMLGDDVSDAISLNDIILNQEGGDIQETRRKLEEMIKLTSDIQTRFSALSHAGLIDAKLDEFDKSKSRIDTMEEYLKHHEGELKSELGNEFIKFKKQLLEAKIGRFGLKFRSENDDVINADLINEDDIAGLQNLSGEVLRFNAKSEVQRIPEDAIYNFACALSNVAVAIRKDSPERSIDLLKKALYFQRQYNIDDSITLLQLGGAYYKLSEIGDKEKNQEEAMKYLLMAKDHSKNPQTSACIHDEIASILLRRGDYRSALNNFQMAREKWPDDSQREKVESDIKLCNSGLRIYDAIESALIRSYRSSKSSRMKADGSQFWGLGGIEKEHLESYLKFELKIDASLIEIEGKPAIRFNKTLAESLEEKLSKTQGKSRR